MTIRLYTERDVLTISVGQGDRLLAAGLAQPNATVAGIKDNDGALRAAWVFAVPGWDTREDGPDEADRWMAQLPGPDGVIDWVAVARHEQEAEWFEDTDADGEAHKLPTPRVRDLYDPPTSGRLHWVTERSEGFEVVEHLIGSRTVEIADRSVSRESAFPLSVRTAPTPVAPGNTPDGCPACFSSDTQHTPPEGCTPPQEPEVDVMSLPHVLITGNPVDGFSFTGPFPNHWTAAEAQAYTGVDWWLAPITPWQSGDRATLTPIRDLQHEQGWSDATLGDMALGFIEAGPYERDFAQHLQGVADTENAATESEG